MPEDTTAPSAEEREEERALILERATELGLIPEDVELEPAELPAYEVAELARLIDVVERNVERARAAAAAAPGPLVTAVAHAMVEAGQVTKTGTNADQGYKFASAEAILAAVRQPLLTRGVLLTVQPTGYEWQTIKADGRGTRCIGTFTFTFRNGAGEELAITDWLGIGEDYGDKAIGKTYTSAVKTFVRTNWLLPTEHDDPENHDPAPPPEPELPAWAKQATRARLKKLGENLEPLLGIDAARALVIAVKGDLGVVPDILVTFSGAIRARMAGDPAPDDPAPAPDDEADAAIAAAAAAEAESGDIEPPDDAGIPPDEDVDPGPPAGSVDIEGELPTDPAKAIAVLRAAGCICADPLGPSDQAEGACPIRGHGIPF